MGYLDQYGVKEAKRERLIKRAVLILVTLLITGGTLFFWFKNYREENRVKDFLATLERGDYAAAYKFWGCTVESPCRNYDYKSFLEDWGPSSPLGKPQSYKLLRSRERGSGVVVTVAINQHPPTRLWVEKSNGVVGFAPPF